MTTDQTKNLIVVLSDLHISNDAPTAWYQSSVHNDYLKAICDWVYDGAATIREMVLLGDVVDFWTHPANVEPPSFDDILQAQQDIFGATGFLRKVLDVLDGAVTYIPGNHDMGVTADDVAKIDPRIKFVDGVYHPLGDNDPRIALAHGNAYTIFNAPDPNQRLPVGHFVTRMLATKWAAELASGKYPPGTTVAGLENQGSPSGLDGAMISTLVEAITSGDFEVTKLMLDLMVKETNWDANQAFVLPGGAQVTLDDVRSTYANLSSDWVNANGGGDVGALIVKKSTLADANGTFMSWFAQRQAFQAGAELIVLGHTHEPVADDYFLTRYANSGFECPSAPDMTKGKAVNFAVIDTDALTAQIYVAKNGPQGIKIKPADKVAPAPIVSSVSADFSSYVTIENTGQDDMTLVNSSVVEGYWVVPPPQTIAAGARAMVWLQDFPVTEGTAGFSGTDGSATYTSPSRGQQTFTFKCPTASFNGCSGGASFRTKSGGSDLGDPGDVAHMGHPFYVLFTA